MQVRSVQPLMNELAERLVIVEKRLNEHRLFWCATVVREAMEALEAK